VSYSVVILSKNAANLVPCVQALQRNEPDLPADRIIVVDDGARLVAESKLPGVTWLNGRVPFVFSANANIGIAYGFDQQGSAAVILLNDDALLSKRRGFSAMVSAHRMAQDFGLVASSCNNVGNRNQEPKGASFIRWERKMLCFVCVLIPRTTWAKVGRLDEDYSLDYGCEDGDMSYRVKQAGLKLGIFDGCFVDHGSLKSTYRSGGHCPFDKNMALFEQKHGIRYTAI
jgi:GT2 family glycosyltransferase